MSAKQPATSLSDLSVAECSTLSSSPERRIMG